MHGRTGDACFSKMRKNAKVHKRWQDLESNDHSYPGETRDIEKELLYGKERNKYSPCSLSEIIGTG